MVVQVDEVDGKHKGKASPKHGARDYSPACDDCRGRLIMRLCSAGVVLSANGPRFIPPFHVATMTPAVVRHRFLAPQVAVR